MAASKSEQKGKRGEQFVVKGQVDLAEERGVPQELELQAYAFDRAGRLLGRTAVNSKGGYEIPLDLDRPADVELVIGPAAEPKMIRQSSAHSQIIAAKTLAEGVVEANVSLPAYVWWPWRPVRICISGHVRKLTGAGACPVPFAKVEIFDVDREGCLWPPLVDRYPRLKERLTVRLPELLREPPFPPEPLPEPRPAPDPLPFRGRPGFDHVQLNPQPLPPREGGIEFNPQSAPQNQPARLIDPGQLQGFNPQPDPPIQLQAAQRVGEMAQAAPSVVRALENLTITSKIAPWLVYPLCFHSRVEICETVTDACGYFRCCFKWYPFHFRSGRLRYDARPDIVLKVTQVINGVPKVIYLDPYSSTRWNVTNAHIDLYLDDEEIICGSCDDNERPAGTQTFFTRVGNDEVYEINQATGLWQQGGLSNVAYGSTLNIHAQFGDTLSRHISAGGATAPYYYRLSYSKDGTAFTPITRELSDTRVDKTSLFSESYTLGPQTVNGTPALYQIRDFGSFYWYNPDRIGSWNTAAVEPDTGKYILRLEVFDANGAKLTSTVVDYRDGTVPPPAVLPSMTDRSDLVITIDNKAPVLDLEVPGVLNECGVIPWSPALTLNFVAHVSQENGRLRAWGLRYTKGVSPTSNTLTASYSASGAPATVNQVVSGAPLLAGLTSTCAFALELWAYAHVRNGYGFIYYREQDKAIAIEKCS